MSQEKRTLVAVLLSVAILVGYSYFFSPPAEKPLAPPALQSAKATEELQDSNAQGALLSPQQSLPTADGSVSTRPALPAPSVERLPEERLDRKNDYAIFSLSSWGGDLQSWQLPLYHETVDKKSPHVDLVRRAGDGDLRRLYRHLGVSLKRSSSPIPLMPDYRVESANDREIVLVWASSEMQLRTVYRFSDQAPVVDISVTWENISERALTSDIALLWDDVPLPPPPSGFFAMLKGPQNLRVPVGHWDNARHNLQKETQVMFTGAVDWVGIEDRYFIAALLPNTTRAQATLLKTDTKLSAELVYPEQVIASGSQATYAFKAYLGAKERNALLAVGNRLDKAIDYGWLSSVAVPILWLMKAFHGVLHNWGLAIIALTVFIKLLLTPITAKSMKSMKAMQTLQPELVKIREKYKNDRERLNVEMMQLFKAHKVNPVGGCLPMLLQMPIYFALYKVLYTSVDLYHAPFGPYRDLAAPDPYFIAPILLGVFMVLQQKLTPSTTADPMQQRMMMLMPVMFSVFMLFLPVGLVIYIFVNTVMTVIHQWMMKNDITIVGLFRKGLARA